MAACYSITGPSLSIRHYVCTCYRWNGELPRSLFCKRPTTKQFRLCGPLTDASAQSLVFFYNPGKGQKPVWALKPSKNRQLGGLHPGLEFPRPPWRQKTKTSVVALQHRRLGQSSKNKVGQKRKQCWSFLSSLCTMTYHVGPHWKFRNKHLQIPVAHIKSSEPQRMTWKQSNKMYTATSLKTDFFPFKQKLPNICSSCNYHSLTY